MSDNKQSRRQRRRRADLGPFASPEAKREAAQAAKLLGVSIYELLGVAEPTAKDGRRFRAGDIRTAAAKIHLHQAQTRMVVEPALAADGTPETLTPEVEVEEHIPVAEEAEAEAAPQPSLWTRFTGWMWREWDKLPDRRLPLPSRPSWLRMPAWRPQFQRPKFRPNLVGAADRLEVWLEGENTRQAVIRTLAVGLALGLILLLVAGLVFIGIGVVTAVLAPAPSPAPTQVAEAAVVSTATPVVPAAVATFTPLPLTPEPTVTPAAAAVVVTPTTAATITAPVTSEVPVGAPVEETPSAAPSPTAPPPAQPATTVVKGHIENGGGVEVRLIGIGDGVLTTADADGNYIFTDVVAGYNYGVEVGETSAPVVVTAGTEMTVTEFHRVVKGDTLWNIYGAHSWSDFTEVADAHGLKHFVDGQGRLIVIIQPGMVFNLAEMSSG